MNKVLIFISSSVSRAFMQNKPSIFLISIGIGLTVTQPVLLMYGLGQFKVSALVGDSEAISWFGLCTAIVSAIMIVMGPGSGWVADRLYRWAGSRRLCMVIGSILGAVALPGFALSPDLPSLILCWLAVNFCYGLVTTSGFALVAVEVDLKSQGKVYGFIGMAIPLCAMASIVLVMGLFAASSMVTKLLLVAVLQVISVLLVVWRVSEQPYRPAAAELSSKRSHHYYPAFKQFPDFTWLLCSKLCLNTAIAGLKMMPLFYVARLQLNEQQVYELNALTAIGTIFLILASIVSGYLCDRYGHIRRFNFIAPIIISLSLLGFSLADNTVEVITASCIMSIGLGISGAVGNLLVNRVLPSFEQYSKDASLLNASVHVGATLIGLLAPPLILWGNYWGGDGYEIFFVILAGIALLASLFIMLIPASQCEKRC
ncbi:MULTISPECIES: MFS transporter [Aeromonas]|uniref:MFS transporter n=1 Tax=Aeromonas TaxID=642 RepID=UPI002906DE90|nr:MFS transporter [Aeromonas sp.]MDU7582800.1 MFS transporter [Aeromonas sp.]